MTNLPISELLSLARPPTFQSSPWRWPVLAEAQLYREYVFGAASDPLPGPFAFWYPRDDFENVRKLSKSNKLVADLRQQPSILLFQT